MPVAGIVKDQVDPESGIQGQREEGFGITDQPKTLTVPGVRRDKAPTGALVTFNWNPMSKSVPSISMNGGPFIATSWPDYGPDNEGWRWETIAVSVPLDQVKDGTNSLAFKMPNGEVALLANINLILVNASAVP